MPRHAAFVGAATAIAVVCAANVAASSDAVPRAAAGVAAEPKPPRLLVMHDGNVVAGNIGLAQGGYEVEVAGGRIFLADSFIWFTAETREAAYDVLRDRLPNATATGHVGLARWCIENRLYSAAQKELHVALKMEPNHKVARDTLLSIGGTLPDEPAKPEATTTTAPVPAATTSNATLGGLPPEAARDFVSKVQPILVNGCGNSACHGTASKSAFRLQNVRLGNPAFKAMTLRNLDAVRAQLVHTHPASSPLLAVPQEPGHGGERRPIFAGPAGQARFKTLSQWAATAARYGLVPTTADEETALSLVSASATAPTPSVDSSRDGFGKGKITPKIASRVESQRGPVATDAASDLLRRVIVEEQPDAFDPDKFNRRYGPQAGQPSHTPSDGPTP